MNPEAILQRDCMAALIKGGFWVIRTGRVRRVRKYGQANCGEDGWPDLYLPSLGHMEIKLPGKPLRPDQVLWHEKARKHGVRVEVAESPEQALAVAIGWRREREWERTMGWPEKSA